MPCPDGILPNHYHHDSLGDPETCTGDHNHPPRRTLEERAEEAAEEATCQRCDVVILEDPSAQGVVFGRLMVPLLRVQHAYQLCGKCGLGLREYLFPGILEDPSYLEVRRQLLTEHWT